MNITPLPVTAFEITDAPGLDPIRVILQDIEPGKGRIIIECFGRAWGTYWGSMGGNLRSFVTRASAEYIADHMLWNQRVSKSDRTYLRRIINAVQQALIDLPSL